MAWIIGAEILGPPANFLWSLEQHLLHGWSPTERFIQVYNSEIMDMLKKYVTGLKFMTCLTWGWVNTYFLISIFSVMNIHKSLRYFDILGFTKYQNAMSHCHIIRESYTQGLIGVWGLRIWSFVRKKSSF
jgi:hypothetical protein